MLTVSNFVRCKYLYLLFLPHNLLLLYSIFTFYFGFYVYELGYRHYYYANFLVGSFDYEVLITSIYLFILTIFLRPLDVFFDIGSNSNSLNFSQNYFVLALSLAGLYIFYLIGHGGYTIGLRIAIVSIITLIVYDKKAIYKYLAYLYIVFITVLTSYEDKREIILIFMSIILTVAYVKKAKIKFRSIFIFLLLILAIYVLIVSASILRGYGGYKIDNFYDFLYAIVSYSKLDRFGFIISENLELLHTFPVYVLTIKHWVFGSQTYFLGESLTTPFFIFFPRSIFPDKPDGAVNYLTNFISESYWINGGSLPVILPNEFIMNFGLYGILFLILFLYVMCRFISNNYFWTNIYFFPITVSFVLTFFITIRGSGLEMGLIGFLPSLLLLIPFLLKKKNFV